MLLSAGIPLPKSILVHGFITHNGQKMSKSLGNVVDPVGLVKQFGTDASRYYYLREITNGRDGDYSDKLFIERYNADLANNLGNLVNRVHTLIVKNSITDFDFKLHNEVFRTKVEDTWEKYIKSMDEVNVHEAVFHVWRLIDFANKMIDEEKPWVLLKCDINKARAVLCNLIETIRHISVMSHPIIPQSSQKIRLMIGLGPVGDIKDERVWGSIKKWGNVGLGSIIFPRIDPKVLSIDR
jgi:methionyl-tRNA synthetase